MFNYYTTMLSTFVINIYVSKYVIGLVYMSCRRDHTIRNNYHYIQYDYLLSRANNAPR